MARIPLPEEDPDESDEEWIEVAPDGGWGWLVLGGTLLVSMLIPGTIKSFGVLFVEFIDVFQATPLAASWIPALCYFLYCSLGPLSSWMCVKTSYRTVTLIGGVFAASGMILSYFATSIIFLCFSYGILIGTGAGLSFPPGIFIVTSYFVKLRGLANGLAVSGSAFGSIVLPPFLRYLLKNYGYRGATLIMGGITLNVLVGALLYEPVERHMKRIRVKKKPSEKELEILLQEETHNCDQVEIKLSDIKVSDVSGDILKPGEKRILEVSGNQDEDLTLILKGVKKPLLEVPTQTNGRKISSPARFATPNSSSPKRKISEWPVGNAPRLAGSTSHIARKMSMMGSNLSTSSFRYVSTAWHGSTLVGLQPDFSSTPQIKKKSTSFNLCGFCKSKSKVEKVDSTQDKTSIKSLLKDPLFVVLLLANATSAIGYTNFIILLPAYAIEIGFEKDMATYLLSIVASLDLVGRIGGAALSDVLKLDKCVYFFGGLLMSGLSLALLPFVSSYPAVAFFCAAFGLASGTYIGITAVIMVDLLGEDLLASSYGLSLFVNGVLQLIGPPICGFVYQQLKQYGLIFALLGMSLILGGCGWAAIPFVRKKANKS